MKTVAVFKDEMLDILRNSEMCYFEGQDVFKVVFEEDKDGAEWMVVWFDTPDDGDNGYFPPRPGTGYFTMRLPKGTTERFLKEWKERM